MATEVVMPQMGESIAEGTIVRWIKKVGDKVDRDEPLFEISTDKVDAEIPSPAAGVLSEIRASEGETVPVNSVVAVIGAAGEAKAATPPAPPPSAAPARPAEPPTPSPQPAGVPPQATAAAPPPASSAPTAPTGPSATPAAPTSAAPPLSAAQPASLPASVRPPRTEDVIRQRSSPLVRKIAKEHQVDISQLHGSGIAGRVTKADILEFIGKSTTQAAAPAAAGPAKPQVVSGEDVVERMSVMRKRIAEHMIASRRTSAHVHSVFEVNFSRVAAIRASRQAEMERQGAKLTYLSFIIKATVDALREMPVVNASIDGDNVVYHHHINIGIAVALDWGLIVPVIKSADEKNLLGISRAVADLANRARAKQLKPEEVQGGTFTITNPGVFGALLGTPIINQPQVAILGVGAVEKRPVVVDDAIAIRPMAYLTLGYDHRLIDGAVADQFMSLVKKTLENWDPAVT